MEIKYILQPVMAMALLHLFVTVLLYRARIGGMKKYCIHPQKAQDTTKLKDLLPAEVNRVSANYNHLFEQPTLFYAVVGVIALMGHVDMIHVVCAWIFVALRVVHSGIQISIDYVIARFSVFVLSWLVFAVMIIRESWFIFF
jgi:hypothetical protein